MKHMGTEGKHFCNFTGPLFTCVSSEMMNNPYRTAGFQLEGKEYEVLYYWTDTKHRDLAITDDELSPLFLKMGS